MPSSTNGAGARLLPELSRLLKNGKPDSSRFPAGFQSPKTTPFQMLAALPPKPAVFRPFHPEPWALGQGPRPSVFIEQYNVRSSMAVGGERRARFPRARRQAQAPAPWRTSIRRADRDRARRPGPPGASLGGCSTSVPDGLTGGPGPAKDVPHPLSKLDESLLSGLPPFSRLSRAEVREILDRATPKRYPDGTAVFREGATADRFYLLLDGFIRVVRTTPGGEQVIALHIPPGQLFGIAPAIGRDTYPATAVSASESLALGWPVQLWPEFTAKYDGFATETYRTLGARLGEVHARVTELATQAVEQRVAAALLRMANQSGRKTAEGIEIGFPVTRADIAEMTGTTLHTVSRLLSAWERDGIVRSTRRHVTVTAPHRLVVLGGAAG